MRNFSIAVSMALVLGYLIPAQQGTTPIQTATVDAPRILYEDAIDESGLKDLMGAQATQYLVIYGHLADPECKSGTIDPTSLVRYIADKCRVDQEGWGVLDFEEPFDSNILKGPTSDSWSPTVDTMVQAIRAVKRVFPKVRWTYYGIPGLDYYLKSDGKTFTWDNAPADLMQREIDRQIAAYRPILIECDWIAPCVYNTVGDGGKVAATNIRAATRAYVKARVAMCVELSKALSGKRFVIPFISNMYQMGGGARCFSSIPYDVLLKDCAIPIHEAGADGACIWTGAHAFIAATTNPQKNQPDFGDCGGRVQVAKTWAADLGMTPEEITSEVGRARVTRMYSDSQRDLLRAMKIAWATPNH
jgi:hypothetical protein